LFREKLEGQLTELRSAEQDGSQIDAELDRLERDLLAQADAMHTARVTAAGKLAKAISEQLGELGMAKAKVEFVFADSAADLPRSTGVSPVSDAGGDSTNQNTGKMPVPRHLGKIERMSPAGYDQVEMLATTNLGQPARPLRKIASGGELSRIMLAIKGELARSDRISVLVFDEIDANVGGRLGSIIGGKLAALGRMHQVLCITHLPQIAAFADRQLTVRKDVVGKATETIVRPVDGSERIEELAEMIGGVHVTATTRKQAEEMLAAAAASSASAPKRKSTHR
jgi:DNA repair protein RecN (Recombination protein N)